MTPQLEVCTFNNTDLKKAIKYKITRIELCQNKELGGITPSKKEIEFATSTEVPIHPIIRPRGGNFFYSKREIKSMMNSISYSKEVGCKGIVLGLLDKNKNMNLKNIDFNKIPSLSKEILEKLNKFKPENLHDAGKISGITPVSYTHLTLPTILLV